MEKNLGGEKITHTRDNKMGIQQSTAWGRRHHSPENQKNGHQNKCECKEIR